MARRIPGPHLFDRKGNQIQVGDTVAPAGDDPTSLPRALYGTSAKVVSLSRVRVGLLFPEETKVRGVTPRSVLVISTVDGRSLIDC